MIAIDTNILLRYLLRDDESQFLKAEKIILGEQKVLVTDVVLVETIWVLKGKRYSLSKELIIDTIHSLLAEANIVFEDSNAVWCALKDFAKAQPIKVNGKIKLADFPDALIVNKAIRHGQRINADIAAVYTFDKAALQIKGTKEPE
jgi:predicted nucleic-acid-binding protein